jgi:Mrp family chromosome partitioning ATPase
VDGVLVVVRANRTSKALVKHVLESLPAGKVLGMILNRADRLAPGYGYGYGKGDYYYKYY